VADPVAPPVRVTISNPPETTHHAQSEAYAFFDISDRIANTLEKLMALEHNITSKIADAETSGGQEDFINILNNRLHLVRVRIE